MKRTNKVVVLFARHDSVYKNLVTDVYDLDRNALTYKGERPVIAHPPCRAWGQLRHFAKPLPGEKDLALWSIELIRKNGGVLEHPRASKLWPQYLPYPGHYDEFGGFTISIDQHWFGHKAKKSTFLYFCGCTLNDLPKIPISLNPPTHTISSVKPKHSLRKPEVSKKWREATPLTLALWLIEAAKLCKK